MLEPLRGELGDFGPELFEGERGLCLAQFHGNELLLEGGDHVVRRGLAHPLLFLARNARSSRSETGISRKPISRTHLLVLADLGLHVADDGLHLGLAQPAADQLLLKALDELLLLLEQLGLQRGRRRRVRLERRLSRGVLAFFFRESAKQSE